MYPIRTRSSEIKGDVLELAKISNRESRYQPYAFLVFVLSESD